MHKKILYVFISLKKKKPKYGNTRQAWIELSIISDPTTGPSNTTKCKNVVKRKLDDVTRDPKYWITQIKLLRGDSQKIVVMIDYVKMITHILYNLSEEYEKIVENVADELDDNTT